MNSCPNCRYQIPSRAISCPRCGSGATISTTVPISIADLPLVTSDTESDIVELSTTVAQPSPRPTAISPKSSGLVTVAELRSGSRPVAPVEPRVADAELYLRNAGEEPLPGYVLLRPLGRGGFGEVWKCEAPGGLLKAIKFVQGSRGADRQLRQEYEAFEQVKAIRHPFLLCLERVEIVGDELVMVMGLADRHIGERFLECRSARQPGIPRDELIGYLREAAEALDVIGAQYGLQHLDVKPANLFLTAGHLQVGDYGLVSKLDGGGGGQNRGLTPKYAAPEVLRGLVHTQSDQYSLALVYYELLTGAFPFAGRTAQQMMMQHITAEPDLAALSAADRGPIAQALAKSPDRRFPSCLDFIDALAMSDPRPSRRSAPIGFPSASTRRPSAESTATAPRSEIRCVVSTEFLRGRVSVPPILTYDEVIGRILGAAGGSADAPRPGGATDGAWTCRFLTSVSPQIAKVKLELVWEQGGFSMDSREQRRVVFRKLAPSPRFFGKKEFAGLEVVVDLPDNGGEVGELLAVGRIVGTPKPDFIRAVEAAVAELFAALRRVLNNVPDRRKHERIRAEFPVSLTALRSDGRFEPAGEGLCIDVSVGGLSLRLDQPPTKKYVYIEFANIPALRGSAILVQIIQSQTTESGFIATGRFRTDF